LTKIPGIKEQAAQVIISEVGLDMNKWNTEKQFSSFLGLSPDNSISGGKVLRRSTRKVYNRAANALRLCAQSLAVLLHRFFLGLFAATTKLPIVYPDRRLDTKLQHFP
jgi:transposase